MYPDYQPFSINRQIFPRKETENSSSLTCGHLNRIKFQPNVDIYLENRAKNIDRHRALARARICHCSTVKNTQTVKQMIDTINNNMEEEKKLYEQLQNIEITIKEKSL